MFQKSIRFYLLISTKDEYYHLHPEKKTHKFFIRTSFSCNAFELLFQIRFETLRRLDKKVSVVGLRTTVTQIDEFKYQKIIEY